MTTTYDPLDPRYREEADVREELTRVYDLCHGCRLCFKFCDAFPSLFELIDRPVPERLVTGEPASRLAQPSQLQSEPVHAAGYGPFDELRLLEHLQVLRNRWLRRAEMSAQLSRGARLTLSKLVQDRSTRPIAQCPKGTVELLVLKHSHTTI